MKEYKIIQQKFTWSNSRERFEEELNNYAKQGWRVVTIYVTQGGQVYAALEKDKNR